MVQSIARALADEIIERLDRQLMGLHRSTDPVVGAVHSVWGGASLTQRRRRITVAQRCASARDHGRTAAAVSHWHGRIGQVKTADGELGLLEKALQFLVPTDPRGQIAEDLLALVED